MSPHAKRKILETLLDNKSFRITGGGRTPRLFYVSFAVYEFYAWKHYLILMSRTWDIEAKAESG